MRDARYQAVQNDLNSKAQAGIIITKAVVNEVAKAHNLAIMSTRMMREMADDANRSAK